MRSDSQLASNLKTAADVAALRLRNSVLSTLSLVILSLTHIIINSLRGSFKCLHKETHKNTRGKNNYKSKSKSRKCNCLVYLHMHLLRMAV